MREERKVKRKVRRKVRKKVRRRVKEGKCKGNERMRRVRRFFVVLIFFKAVLFLVHNML